MKTNQLRAFMLMVLLVIARIGFVSAQSLTVTGRVTDSNNKPIAKCLIVVKGTSRSTTSDVKGVFSIAANKGETLVFKSKNYNTLEHKVISSKLIVKLTRVKQVIPEIKSEEELSSVKDIAEMSISTADMRMDSRALNKCVYPYAHPYIQADQADAEEYKSIVENTFKDAIKYPLSTFSVDVDAASYSNMRRFINRGILPQADVIRTEELVNYFSYDYPKATGKDPVKITMEAGICPWNKENRLVRIGLKAREIPTDNLPESNLVFLIDVSGSMWGPTRLGLVQSSLKLLVNNLRDKDKVAVVVYAGSASVKLPATSGSDKQKIREAIDELTAGGSTAGGDGIQLAYKIAKQNFIPKGNNRIILCTDGDFNVGVSSEAGLEQLIERERKTGVFLTVLGYGMGNYKDAKIQTLAEKGNGNHAYIDNLQEANKVLVGEFGATLYTVAKDVKLQVEFNPARVQAYRLVGYESRLLNDEDFNNDAKDAGELSAGHTVTAFYEVIPVGGNNNYIGKIDDLKYQTDKKSGVKTSLFNNSSELLTVKLRYKAPDKDVSQRMILPFTDKGGDNVSSDFRFASAVAMFGQLLRDSDYKGDATYDKVIYLAKQGLTNDDKGYRREFVRLAETAKGIGE